MKMEKEMIKLGEYPYTYVRVVAMKSLLFRQQDYDKILKMKLDEIASYVQDSTYTKEINELANTLSGFDLLEHALTLNSVRSLEKLKKISPKELEYMINLYLRRNDFFNLKTIIRAKQAKIPLERIENLLIPSGKMNKEEFIGLYAKDSVEEILKSTKLKFIRFKEALDYLADKNSLMLVENVLDHIYFKEVLDSLEEIPDEGKLFREFLQYEIDVINLKLILKLKLSGADEKTVGASVISGGKVLSKARLNGLVALDFEHVLEEIKKTKFNPIIKDYVALVLSDKSLIGFEHALDRFLLKKASQLIHKHPLSVDIILGYMFAKEIEVRNLKMIIKGKQLGIDEQIIEKQVVV